VGTFERFTDRARHAQTLEKDEARRFHQSFTGTERILMGLVREDPGVGARAFQPFGVSLEAVGTP